MSQKIRYFEKLEQIMPKLKLTGNFGCSWLWKMGEKTSLNGTHSFDFVVEIWSGKPGFMSSNPHHIE